MKFIKTIYLCFVGIKSKETRYKVKTLFEYSDFKRYLDLSYAQTIERLRKEVKTNG